MFIIADENSIYPVLPNMCQCYKELDSQNYVKIYKISKEESFLNHICTGSAKLYVIVQDLTMCRCEAEVERNINLMPTFIELL